MTPTLTAEQRPTPPREDDWSLCLLFRDGAPPLRFSGRLLFRHDGNGAIELHQRRRGGFTLAVQTPSGRRQACHATDLCGAMNALEEICVSETHPPVDVLGDAVDSWIDTLASLYRYRAGVHDFLVLAGTAMNAWDVWNRQTSWQPTSQRGTDAHTPS